MSDDRHLRVVGPDDGPAPRHTAGLGAVSDRIGSRCLTLLAGYVRGGSNDHDMLMRAVGVCEANYIASGIPLDNEHVSGYIDTMLTELQALPDDVLVRLQDVASLYEQVCLIGTFLKG